MFFSSAHGKFSKIDHMLGHKTSLSKFKRIEIILSIISDHSVMKLEINYTRKIGKFISMWRLSNMLLNNQWVKEEIKEYPETNGNRKVTYQHLWHAAKAVPGGKFIKINAYLKKPERSQINNLTYNSRN